MSHLRTRQRIPARRHRPDYGLVVITVALLLLGLVVIFSLGPAIESLTGITAAKQFIAILAGLAAFLATALIPITFWHKIQPVLILAALGSSFMLLFAPEINGATRWIQLGGFSFQPSELLKFALIIYLASFLARRARQEDLNDANATLIPLSIILGLLGLFVALFQKDLGTMIVVALIFIAMLYISGVRFKHISILASGLVAAGFAAVLLAPHRLSRVLTFLDSGSDIQGAGYHVNQALIAVGSGGVFGLGLGQSVQAFGYLPEVANDSIFAIYAEKFGFVGSVITILLFGALLFRIIRVIERAPNVYMRLLATGVFAWLFAHVVINIGAMLNLMPLTGITLPLLSHGGSSLLFTMAGLGLVFNISRYTAHRPLRAKGRS